MPVKIQLMIVMIISLIAVYCLELYKEFVGCLLAEQNSKSETCAVEVKSWVSFKHR
ncbi:hypothetical protein Xmau_01319 [Xenorhabdus mauleonii]|uniref:Hok/gef family protein n=1 Tax=Xenorhabdus mauleonii TaxID=351675 RepID=A0A1I3KPG7_9GAMM|nr:hypothetical protein Xmau_01319 [Xenorhabdus mauleonii]SFI74264.1 hypothetical protein SAMN05421680_103148 [Xenorhabdus mauleonii]